MVRLFLAALLLATAVACEGEQGPPGPSGAESNRYCNRLTGGLLLEYQAVRWASGDVMVVCSITDVTSEHSATTYYRAGDTGTGTGLCRLGYDFDLPYDGGYWDFRYDAPGERATFSNPRSDWDQFVVTFAAGDCVG